MSKKKVSKRFLAMDFWTFIFVHFGKANDFCNFRYFRKINNKLKILKEICFLLFKDPKYYISKQFKDPKYNISKQFKDPKYYISKQLKDPKYIISKQLKDPKILYFKTI